MGAHLSLCGKAFGPIFSELQKALADDKINANDLHRLIKTTLNIRKTLTKKEIDLLKRLEVKYFMTFGPDQNA